MKFKFLNILFIALTANIFAQTKLADSLKNSALNFHKELNEQYADSVHSPLLREDRLKFKAHDFYAVDLKYCVEVKLVRTPDEKTFEMPTSGKKRPMYVKYGEFHFKIDGKNLKLNVYQSMDLLNKPEYKDYLFIPFRDLTTGKETYGGGRFIEMYIPSDKKIHVDFNKAFNPYCAYNHNYSCPIPPKENDLDIEIKAGIKLKPE